MKPLLNSFFLFVVFFIFLSSCKKISPITFKSISGKWNIQKDTTYPGVGIMNHQVVYSGQRGDYFNFTSDGHIYIRENSILDTLTYTISSDSITIPAFGDGAGNGVGKGQFQSPSTRSLIIRSEYMLTPGGILGRTVVLKR